MKNYVNKTKKTRERKTKEIHIKLSDKEYVLFEEMKKKRSLDTRNYLRYLISNDIDNFYNQGVAGAINVLSKISVAAEGLSENCCKCQCGKECTIRPFTINIMKE